MRTHHLPRDLVFACLVTVAFAAVASFATAHHEMWRDEMQAWLIARDSKSLADLFHNLAYEAHPPLWYLLLYPIAHATQDPVAMQVVHVAIASASVFVFAAFAPFSRPLRALFAAGYFPLYEYAAIARGYGLGLFFALAFAATYARRRTHQLRAGLLLALLACTSAPAFLLAVAATAVLLVDAVRARRGWLGPLVAITGLAASLAFLVPHEGTTFTPRLGAPGGHMFGPLGVLTSAFAAVPIAGPHYWNQNLLLQVHALDDAAPVLAIVLFAWFCFVLAKDRRALAMYAGATLLLLALFCFGYFGDLRHHGFLYVAFVVAAWIAAAEQPRRLPASTLGVLFACHAVGAWVAISQDVRYVFSSGELAAAQIRARHLDEAILVVEPDWAAATVLGYLGRDALNPRTGRAGSFVVWTRERASDPSDEEVLAFAAGACRAARRDAIVLLNHPLRDEDASRFHAERGDAFPDSVVRGEDFVVYAMRAATCGAEEARK